MSSEDDALAQLRAAVLRGDTDHAERIGDAALREHPRSAQLRRALAGIYRQTRRDAQAQALLGEVLHATPGDFSAAFTLAEICVEQGRLHAAAQVLRSCFEVDASDPNLAIRAIELLADAQRQTDAAAIAESAIAAHPDDARLHAYAGMLLVQIGQFERARAHYLFALAHDARACEWNAPHGLASAQRYADATHPDFALLSGCLARTDLSDTARSGLLFALGKAHDDIGDYAQAARHFRDANALARAATRWSRKHWKRAVESRLAGKPLMHRLPPPDWVPVFIVGMPRSGTTLLADRLARFPRVCNRGELPWLAKLAALPVLAGNPSPQALARAAQVYAAQLRQDDAGDAHWIIDKQPLNLRYVDLVLALWPNAKILWCRRHARDTALSLWQQSFSEEVQGYACNFDDISLVMRDVERLFAHWHKHFGESMREIRYEQLASDAPGVLADVADWLGMPAGVKPATDPGNAGIGTASLWQARQAVYTRSIGRWRNYAADVPELRKLPDA
jgi:tetratricopeptide (TPR) repeat protein